jgi:hypothetical protein
MNNLIESVYMDYHKMCPTVCDVAMKNRIVLYFSFCNNPKNKCDEEIGSLVSFFYKNYKFCCDYMTNMKDINLLVFIFESLCKQVPCDNPQSPDSECLQIQQPSLTLMPQCIHQKTHVKPLVKSICNKLSNEDIENTVMNFF